MARQLRRTAFVTQAHSYELHSPSSRASATKTELRTAAIALVNDYLLGRFGEVDETFGPVARTLLLEQLLARCPGFSTRDYRSALGSGLSARNRGHDQSLRR